jgi:dTDP-4-dehydrorhamnose reductase
VDQAGLELWGGPECTICRVGKTYADQFERSGHYRRARDLELFAGLGLSALRYPVLWERFAASGDPAAMWWWHDGRFAALDTLGLRAIVGLLHHGSGPSDTDLLDTAFPSRFADFALQVASRYPWVEEWTPINEPLTTARFSALYGHWYPHHRDEASFWRALLNQIDATRLAMRAIRSVNPRARLLQTDDLGRTYATAALRDQAGFDNVRRWAGWDLLCGMVVRGHPFWERLVALGLRERLDRIADDPCPPDRLGINHYLTSDRFLDHRQRLYPRAVRGGSAHARYADVAAIRVLDPRPAGLAGAVREAWDRYRIPIVLSEVHNGSTRDEQMRWLAEAWDTAHALRGDGVAVEAVTAWSLLGSADWDTLLTRPGSYEPGAFDTSGGAPRATAVVPLLQGLPRNRRRHPVLGGAGWWRRPERLLHTPLPRPAPIGDHAQPLHEAGAAPLLICGATGTLGQAFAAACRHRAIAHVLTARAELDLEDPASIAEALDRIAPWAVIDATGWVRVDDAERDPAACMRINADGATALAQACDARGLHSVHFSSDLVFDGRSGRSYSEEDTPAPRNVYGRSKAAMESAVTALPGSHLIIRTAAFFSPHDDANFAVAVATALAAGDRFAAAGDQIVSPTYVPELVDRTLDLLIDQAVGIWHIANDAALSWAEFARRIALACDLDPGLVTPVVGQAAPALRPANSALTTQRGAKLGRLQQAIEAFAEVRARAGRADTTENRVS